jgi:hypothetical protein
MQSQISRHRRERVTRPFERVHFDIMQSTKAYNGDRWASHFLCEATQVQHGFTHREKLQIRQSVMYYAAYVERQYDVKVLTFHTDGEKSMEEREIGIWILSSGFNYETSAPYTSEQNGLAERSGGVIMRRSRALRVEARLPEDLWPELFFHSIKIGNLTPTEQLGWLTPIEKLNQLLGKENPKPSGSNLYIIGSRVYVKINNIPKTRKLAPRALIGYLVGYDATNIFRVWTRKTCCSGNSTLQAKKLTQTFWH